MASSVTTPTKTTTMFQLQTPEATDMSNAPPETETLLDTFSGMRLQGQHQTNKRTADVLTIEGSPVSVQYWKRQDSQPTPKVKNSFFRGSMNDQGNTKLVPRRVLVFSSGTDDHDTGTHQENALRTALICGPNGCLRRRSLADFVVWADGLDQNGGKPAPLADLLRVHEYPYLAHLEKKCKGLGPMPPFYAPTGFLDTDTPLARKSLEASRKFCGAAMRAVDQVMSTHRSTRPPSHQQTTHAFVLGRPPGHHAGPNGCVPSRHYWKRPDMASSGFCLLNTVAVAAAYARYKYRREQTNGSIINGHDVDGDGDDTGLRIAIVDIDIHHGNGTEEIVRNLTPHQIFLPLPSSWSPMSQLSYKPWLNERDAEEVFFGSVNLFAEDRFYPCSGGDSEELTDSRSSHHHNHHDEEMDTNVPPPLPTTGGGGGRGSAGAGGDSTCVSHDSTATAHHPSVNHKSNIVNIGLTPVGPGPWDPKARARLSIAQRTELCHAAGKEMREKVSQHLLPQLMAFAPDLLFISAGFDAHFDDLYHYLTEEDYHWLTEQLCTTVVPQGGKVISILEGGYSLSSPIPPPTRTQAKAAAAAAAVPPSAVAVPAEVTVTHSRAGKGKNKKYSGDDAAASGGVSVTASSIAASGVRCRSSSSDMISNDGASGGFGPAGGGGGGVSSGLGGMGCVDPSSSSCDTRDDTCMDTMDNGSLIGGGGHHLTTAAAGGDSILTLQETEEETVAFSDDYPSKYAQLPGDGGLIKGVLAHVAGLAGIPAWIKKQ